MKMYQYIVVWKYCDVYLKIDYTLRCIIFSSFPTKTRRALAVLTSLVPLIVKTPTLYVL